MMHFGGSLGALLRRGIAPSRLAKAGVASVLISIVVASPVAAQTHLTASQWREDLHYLVEQIQTIHPDAFHHVTQSQFMAASAKVDAEIPSLSDHEIEVELAQLVAMLGEGHSRLSLPGLADPMSDVKELTPYKDPSLAFHTLPVRAYLFSDGLFVVAAAPEYKSLIGSQIVQIGNLSAQSALDAVQPIINRDNDMGARLIGPDFVAVPEILSALHITKDASSVPVTFRARDGNSTKVDIAPLHVGDLSTWISADDAIHAPNSSYAAHAQENLWTEYDSASGTLLARVNVIQDSPGQPVAKFASRIEALAASRTVKRFVIDFRDCHGGDNQKFRALLLTILRDTKINQLGQSFVLINRATFSAAVNATSDLERLSNSILVGEPTAGAPSSWGDPRKVTLPNSGLIFRISSIYWRDWISTPTRPWIAPDISIPVTSADYFAGRDPVMAAVLNFPLQSGFSDVLVNLVHSGAPAASITRLYYQHKTDAVWADETTENAMQAAGEAFLAKKAYDDAFLMFAINWKEYPGSLSRAIQSAQTALAVDPDSESIKNLLEKLGNLQSHS